MGTRINGRSLFFTPQVPNADETDFPVLISGAYSYLATTSNGGQVTSANGFDIIFTSDSAGTNPLPYERESYNSATGAVSFWVQVPTLSHTADTVIYLFYGKSSVTTDQSNPTAVWDSNFKGVWHMSQGTALSANDSTSNGNNGSLINSPAAVVGQIDGAVGLNGSTQYLRVPSSSSFKPTSGITLSGWVYLTGTSNWSPVYSLDYRADGTWTNPYQSYSLEFYSNTNEPYVNMAINGSFQSVGPGSALALNTWHYLATTYDGTTMRLFVDGSDIANTTSSGSISYSTSQDLAVGQGSPYSPGYYLPGNLDELRISSTPRSANWIATEFNNQSSPWTFYDEGSPAITGLSPISEHWGDSVTISGRNFGTSMGSSFVSFNGAQATVTSWSATSVVVTVPVGAESGNVVVTVSGVTSNGMYSNIFPAAWADQDIGSVGTAGSATYSGSSGTFTVRGAGNGVQGTGDNFNFASQPLSGDGTIVARVVSLQGGGSYQEAGVMIRETLSASATMAFVGYQAGSSRFIYRTTTGGSATTANGNGTPPYWFKLVRSGSSFTAYAAPDGVNWSQLGSTQTISMATSVYVGLAVSGQSTLASATFDNFSINSSAITAPVITSVSATTGAVGNQVVITGSGFGSSQNGSLVLLNDVPATISSWSNSSITFTVPSTATTGYLTVCLAPSMSNSNPVYFEVTTQPLPSGWLNQDVGTGGLTGSSTFSSGTFTVNGSGADIYGTADGMQFAYQPLSGDGTIVARLVNLQGGSGYPKAGVMIRESLSPGSTNAYTLRQQVTGTNFLFSYRSATGRNTTQASGTGNLPYWIKVTRSGSTHSAVIYP